MILRIAGGLPECSGYLVLEGNQGSYATGATVAQILLAGPRQREADALSAIPFANGEPIQVPPPAVPGGDQGADNLIAALGDEEGGRGIPNQALDIV